MRITSLSTDAAVLAELGKRLERSRLERNVTQEQLAHEAGVSRSTVVRVEAGEPVKTTAIVRILRALGLADQLDLLVPEPLPSPVELLRRQGRPRRRAASRSQRAVAADAAADADNGASAGAGTDAGASGGWSWGDAATPGHSA
jgi:transcriptional regulator with XRE-family HTH domain